jgi:hypothetical protein
MERRIKSMHTYIHDWRRSSLYYVLHSIFVHRLTTHWTIMMHNDEL